MRDALAYIEHKEKLDEGDAAKMNRAFHGDE